MATTTNFGWETPDDTDLVKDGALAMRTLGNSIDSSFVDLKGGTTGQVLAKASNTDLDYTWVTQDDANAIQNAIVDAKGDLIAASAADTPARLAVGNNGETLVADSSASTGLRWNPSQSTRNFIINGAFDIWQRGTTGFGSGGALNADRWRGALNSGTLAISRSTDVPTNPYFNYSLSMVGTSATNAQIYTRIESLDASQLAGQTVTLTVWAKSTAGTSAISFVTYYPTTTADDFSSTTTDVSGNLSSTSPSGSWTKYTATFTVNALATRGYQILVYRNGAESSTTLFTGIKLELGSVSTPFTRAGGTLPGELAACQRYYEVAKVGFIGYAISGTDTGCWLHYSAVKRTSPTVTVTRDYESSPYVANNGSVSDGNDNGVMVKRAVTASGGGYWFSQVTASAEL